MATRSLLIALLVAGISASVAFGQAPKVTSTSGLLSKKPLERQAAYNRIIRGREVTIQELVFLIERQDVDKDFYGPLHRAVVLLGKLRAAEAVQALTKLLMYVPGGFRVEEAIPSEAYYVAAVALWQIGQPSIPAMLMIIRHSDDPAERNVAAWVIMQIEGQDQAAHRMEMLVAGGKLYKERFEAAKQFIETYKPTFEHPHRLSHKATEKSH